MDTTVAVKSLDSDGLCHLIICLRVYVYVTFDGCCLGRVCLSTLAMIMICEFRSIFATIEIVLEAQKIVNALVI